MFSLKDIFRVEKFSYLEKFNFEMQVFHVKL